MKREELEHLLIAVGSITGAKEVYVFGSQVILAQSIQYDEIMHRSMEADIAIPGDLGKLSDEIEGSLGEGSTFAVTFGYYAEGVEQQYRELPEVGFIVILHYQKIIVSFSETDRLMEEVDRVML